MVSDLKRLVDRTPLLLEQDELLNWKATKQLAAARQNLSTFISESIAGDSIKELSTLLHIYNPGRDRFSYLPVRRPERLWSPPSL
jgi:hypothetical protein